MRHNLTREINQINDALGQVSAMASTKDVGRVKLGGSTMRYVAPLPNSKDSDRVKLGGSTMRF